MTVSQQIELACRAADRGRFDEAVRLCRQIPEHRLEFSASRALLASVYRQAGRHDLALPYDEEGLASGVPDPLGAAMCRLGLAADRIGAGDLAAARADWTAAQDHLASVARAHWAVRWFDPQLTRAWVGAELGLMADRPAEGVALLEPFLSVRRDASPTTRWHFEYAKTLLFLGVSQRCCGMAEPAVDNLAKAARVSAAEGLAALLVPIVAELRGLDPERAREWDGAIGRAREVLERHRPPQA